MLPWWRPWSFLLAASLAGALLLLTGWPILAVPVQAALAWWILWADLRAGRLGAAARHMLFWAWATSLWTIAATLLFPESAATGIFHGRAYREEMFTWIRTGVGAEGDPRLFLPQHFLHYGLTLGGSFLTAGLGGLALGCVLLDYMNFYVGELIRASAHPALAVLVGWPVWSIVRVAAFVLGAVGAAHILLARVLRRAPWQAHTLRLLLGWSGALFLADLALKATLAPVWRGFLQRALLP